MSSSSRRLPGFVLFFACLADAFAAERVLGTSYLRKSRFWSWRHCRHRLDPVLSVHPQASRDSQRFEDAMTLVLAALSLWASESSSGNRKRAWFPVDRNSAPALQLERALLLAALLQQVPDLPRVVLASPVARSQVLRALGVPSSSGASAAYRSGGLAGVSEAGASAAMSPLRRATTASATTGKQAIRLRALRRTVNLIGHGA